MTSIAETTRPSRGVAALRAALLTSALTLAAWGTPWPWSALWLAVPFTVAGSLLLAWRFGAGALALTALLAVAAVLAAVFPSSGLRAWHALWLPAASLTGVWMGLREEGGGPGLGDRAWMHAPLLAVALAMPVMPGMHSVLVQLEAAGRTEETAALKQLPASDKPSFTRTMLEESLKRTPEQQVSMLAMLTPNLLFLWMLLLVAAGRALAARAAAWLAWPPLSRAAFTQFRLPDAALAPLLAGLALALLAPAAWQPLTAVLLACAGLGYSVQGVAVTASVLLARGVPHAFILILMVCLFAFTLPVFLPSVALIGLSDVWLDHRRLEPSPRGEA